MKNLPKINSERWLDIADLPQEEWAQLDNPGCMVSNYGRVKSLPCAFFKRVGRGTNPNALAAFSLKPHIYKGINNGKGYYACCLEDKKYYIHRLVARAFIPNPMGYPEIDHIDGDKSNNCVNNLRWCNRKMNMANAVTRLKTEVNANKQKKPVIQLTSNGEYVREWDSATTAALALKISRSVIIDVLRPRAWRKTLLVRGFIFIYKEDYDPQKEYFVKYKSYAGMTADTNMVISDTGIANVIEGNVIMYFPNTRLCGRFYGVSGGAVVNYMIRKKQPRKFLKKSSKLPHTLAYYRELTPEQQLYIKQNLHNLLPESLKKT